MDWLRRRTILRAVWIGGIAAAAGCVSEFPDDEGDGDDTAEPEPDNVSKSDDAEEGAEENEEEGEDEEGEEDEPGEGPPVADRSLPEEYGLDELADEAVRAGPPPDGIPSIDDPSFNDADDPPFHLEDASPVFGVVIDGEARAYPQYILVWHEIVNDVVAGEPVAVTYCPLTGTAQGFRRGETTFGVTGWLINANLVMFDRGSESFWSQMLAWGLTGPHRDDYLDEFRVVWTTWKRWRENHPDTVVLNEDTGHVRDYGRDPYGSYNPPSEYYANDQTLFPPLAEDDRFTPKTVVIGARHVDGAMCVPKEELREKQLIEGTVGEVPYLTVYEPTLDTGYVYRDIDAAEISHDGTHVFVDGEEYAPDELPFERVVAYDAMWMAWFGYYPSTTVHS